VSTSEAIVAVTDAGIRAIEALAKRIQKADGNGLSLDVVPSGKKSWLYRYRLLGDYGRVTLGRYPDLSLKAARKKRDEMAVKVANGIDPAGRKARRPTRLHSRFDGRGVRAAILALNKS
jgi:hypothetical protein